MSTVNRRWGLAVSAALLAFGLGVPAPEAQAQRVGAFGTVVGQGGNQGIRPYFQVAPGLTIQQAAYNIRTMGAAYSMFPPWAAGFAPPVALGYAPGPFTASNPGVPLPGTARAIANSAALNPGLTTYFPNPYPFSPYLAGGGWGSGTGYGSPSLTTAGGYYAPYSPYGDWGPYGQDQMTGSPEYGDSTFRTVGNGYGGYGRLERHDDAHPHTRSLLGTSLTEADGALSWPVGLTALPDSKADELRKQIQAAVDLTASKREKGQAGRAALRNVIPAVRQLHAMLYDRKGEITEQSYLESERFLRQLSKAVRELE
jgi:hypothetical protein